MNFFLLLLIGLGIYAGIFALFLLGKKLIKKVSFKSLFLDWDNLFRFGTFFLLYLIFALIIRFSYARTSITSIIFLGICTSLVTVLIPFISLINKIKNKEWKSINYFKVAGYFGAILLLVLEVTAFSSISFRNDDQKIDIPFNSALIVDKEVSVIENDKMVFQDQRGYLTFDNTSHEMRSIYFDFSCEDETRIQIDVYTSDDGNSFYFRHDYKFDSRFNEFEYFSLEQISDENYIKCQFVIDETNIGDYSSLSTITLHEISINKAFPFVFNPLRLILTVSLLSAIILIIQKGRKLVFSEISALKKVENTILILAGVGLIAIIINALIFSSTHFVSIDQVNGNSKVIYYQLFDAFRKGQLHLDTNVGIEELLALDNPYNPDARNFYYLWDHAFYNGKYYCYYGVSPVILIMFPLYLLSGFKYVPSILFILEIGTLFSIFVFLLAIVNLVKLVFERINIPFLIFGLVGALFTSLLLSNTIFKVGQYNEGIYRIPYAYGLCFFFLTFLMLFKAYDNFKLRALYLGIAGLSVVLVMASRPTLIFGLLLAIPLLLKIWLEKYPLKEKIIDNVPMFSVVIIGAIFICLYNYLRFDSIFEFGQTYQLTLTDNTKLAYSVKGFVPTVNHFYNLPPKIGTNIFPFLDYGYNDSVERYHVYNAGSAGLLFFPMFWSVIAMPFVFDKDDDLFIRITHYISPIFIFLLAFTTYCFAGVCPRYVVELTAVSSFFTFIPLMKAFEKGYLHQEIATIVLFSVIVLTSSFLGFNLLFNNFDGWKEADQHGLLEVIRSIFNNYNI